MKIILSLLLILLPVVQSTTQQAARKKQTAVNARNVKTLSVDGLQFKDLNKNGKLDVYEDWRKSASVRAKDLVAQMTLAEKAGAMMHGTLRTGARWVRWDSVAIMI